MATIHDEIDSWLAADVHDQLSEEERHTLHNHLVECADCRRLHQENKLMNKIIEETLSNQKPDPRLEQRMLDAFRDRVPQRRDGLADMVMHVLRLRSARIVAVAAVLLALVQLGRMLTPEGRSSLRGDVVVATAQRQKDEMGQFVPAQSGAGRAENIATAAPPPSAPSTTGLTASDSAAKSALQSFAAPAGQLAGGGRAIVARSNTPTAEEAAQNPAESSVSALANRKLIRNATVELEIVSFDTAVQKITAFANEERGYVATTSSAKQANGKLRGEVVVKVVPENLDRFLQKVRGLGELKNQTLGAEDVTKAYFDTDARLKNARVMEQRLIDMLKTKTGKVSDLLQVEKELGRVREEIEKMQGELKYWDSQVNFATVTISLSEKEMEEPAAFLLKERAQLALFAADVEKVYNEIKDLASPNIQITNAQLDRDNSGNVSARISMLISPEESESDIARIKGMGRTANFQMQTERIAQGGTGMSQNAKTKRDKVELNITISRETDEQAVQETSLRILTSKVDEKTALLKANASKNGAEIRNSTFSRDANGREIAYVVLRTKMKDYAAIMKSFEQLGEVKDVTIQRRDRIDRNGSEEGAPADISIQIYSQGNIVASDTGFLATLRQTIGQGAGALMWSLRMIGVAIAFLAPWAISLAVIIWIVARIRRARSK